MLFSLAPKSLELYFNTKLIYIIANVIGDLDKEKSKESFLLKCTWPQFRNKREEHSYSNPVTPTESIPILLPRTLVKDKNRDCSEGERIFPVPEFRGMIVSSTSPEEATEPHVNARA